MAIMQTLWQWLVSKILYVPLFVFFTLHSFFLYVRSLGGFCSVDQSTKAPKNESVIAFKRSPISSHIPMSLLAPNTPGRNQLKEMRLRHREMLLAQHAIKQTKQTKQGAYKHKSIKPGPIVGLEFTGSHFSSLSESETKNAVRRLPVSKTQGSGDTVLEAPEEKLSRDSTTKVKMEVLVLLSNSDTKDSVMRLNSKTPCSIAENPSSFSTPTVVNSKSLSPHCQALRDRCSAELCEVVTKTGDLQDLDDGRSDAETTHSDITNSDGSGKGTPIDGHSFFSDSEMKHKDNVNSDRRTPSSGRTSAACSPRMRDELNDDDLGSDLGQGITTNSGTNLVGTIA